MNLMPRESKARPAHPFTSAARVAGSSSNGPSRVRQCSYPLETTA